MKSIFKYIWVLGLCAGISESADLYAQATKNPPKTATKAPVATSKGKATVTILPDTVKIPKFITRFGPYNGTTPAPASDLKKIMSGNLVVSDQQGQQWTPIAWRFIWNKKEVTDDIKTGRRKNIITYNMVEVDSTSILPLGWQNELKEFLQPGEEIIFERIIIEHPGSKRKMMAADLRIKVI
jgi:hypothetical protein